MTTEMIKFSEVITREEFKSGQLYFDTPANLREYFLWIKDRFEGGEQYPYDLEELVGIAFTSKQKAVEALKRDFTQPIDFTRSTQKLSGNPIPKDTYRLSPLCFESMVARRCQPVMEIYVKIFHAVVSPVAPQMVSYLDMFDMMSKVMRDQEARMLKVESSQKLLEERVNEALPKDYYLTVMGFCSKHKLRMTTEAKRLLGVDASRLCKQRNLMIDRVPDKRYGSVNAYPEDVLCELCELA